MSLRTKTIAWVAAIFLVSLIVMNLLFRLMTLQVFRDAEADFTVHTVERLDACFAYENVVSRLNAGLWGYRADIYDYMDTRRPSSIGAIVNPGILAAANTDFFMLMDLYGNIVFEMTLDRDGRERPLSYAERKSVVQLIPSLDELTRNGEVAGLFVLGSDSYEIGISRISPAPGYAVRGYCIVGTHTDERIRNISAAFQNPLHVYNIFGAQNYPPDVESALTRAVASDEPFVVDVLPETLKVWVPGKTSWDSRASSRCSISPAPSICAARAPSGTPMERCSSWASSCCLR